MVQILESNDAMAQLSKGLSSLPDALGQFIQRKREQQKSLKESEMRKHQAKALGIPEEILDPTLQKAFFEENKKSERNAEIMKLLGGGGEGLQDGEEGEPSQTQEFDDTNILKLSLLNPQLANLLQAQKSTKQKGEERTSAANQSQRQFEHTQTGDFAKELRENASQAHEVKEAAKSIRKALKKDATGATGRNLALKYLQNKKSPFANIFQTEDTQAITSASKALAGGFRQLFGSKPTQSEFFWYENILPDILKDAATNEKSLEYFEKVADIHLKMQDLADKITKENKGYRPIDLDAQVRERMKDKLDALVQEGENLYSKKQLQGAPDPKSNIGRVIEDENGRRYRSNGKEWEEV